MAAKDNTTQNNPLMAALRQFEATEANLVKCERVWGEISSMIPSGIEFKISTEYDDKCRIFKDLLASLPAIDGWKPTVLPMDLNEIAQNRLDAQEIQEIAAIVHIDELVESPGNELREYRFRFNKERRSLIRGALAALIETIGSDVQGIRKQMENGEVKEEIRESTRNHLAEIDTLLGSSVAKPKRWWDMHRHLRFAELHDYKDIINLDWPAIQRDLQQTVYEADEPLPVEVFDLAELTKSKPTGSVSRQLHWERLTPEEFERLIYTLMIAGDGYENPQWLTATNAPDKGRDLSVERVIRDALTGTLRHRILIQCKHWLSKSVSPAEVALLKEQVKHWEPPRIDVVIIATSGRFTTDAIQLIEKHNQSDSALRIEMWPESHLETLLASRPDLIAEFGLR